MEKKRFTLFLCAICAMLMLLGANAFAAEEFEAQAENFEIQKISDTSIQITNNYGAEKQAVVIKAAYNADGTLKSVVKRDVSLVIGPNAIDYINISEGDSIMLWDSVDNMVPLAKTFRDESIEVKASDYEEYISGDSPSISFYTNEKHTKSQQYELSENAVLYVNGEEYLGTLEDGISNYIDGNPYGTVTLVDYAQADGKYDKIMVSYYVTAIFDQVVSTDSYTRLAFSNHQSGLDKSYIDYDTGNPNMSYSFTMGLSGEKIAYTDLQQGDVLSIEYDVNGYFSCSNFYDVYVSRDTVTGVITDSDEGDGEYIYTIDGKNYTAGALGDKNLEVGTEYKLYLNVFGRYEKKVDISVQDNIAIIDSFYLSSEGKWCATAIRVDGKKYTYELRNQSGSALTTFSKLVYGGDGNYTAANNNGKRPVQDRIATIYVNSSDCIYLGNILAYSSLSGSGMEYSSSTSTVGEMKIDENTVLMDLTKYESDGGYGTIPMSYLVDEAEYTVYGYQQNEDGVYKYMLILDGGDSISGRSPMTVLVSVGSTSVDGNTTDRLKVFSEGEEKYLIVDPDETVYVPYIEGTPFFYVMNTKGYVKNIDTIMTDTYSGDYFDFVRNTFETAYNSDRGFNSYVKQKYTDNFGTSRRPAYIHFGPIVDKNDKTIELGGLEMIGNEYYSNTQDDRYLFEYSSDMKAYTYSMEARSGLRAETATAGSIPKTVVPNIYKYTEDWTGSLVQSSSGEYINWSAVLNDTDDVVEGINFALVKEYEDEATEILVMQCTSD